MRRPEAIEQSRGVKLIKKFGGKVWVNSQTRKANVTPGVPDVVVGFPMRGVAFFWEAKARGGKPSEAQLDFLACFTACRWSVVIGGYDALREHLTNVGIIGRAA